MPGNKRVDIRGILADPNLRRKLMVSTIQATQAREGIETTTEQAERAYYVVTEAENAAFFNLHSDGEYRHKKFVGALHDATLGTRFDSARSDFAAVEGSPLAYRHIRVMAQIFRESVSLEPALADARQGLSTANDPRFVRYHWEVPNTMIGWGLSWVTFAKGGGFSRFFQSFELVVFWRDDGDAIKKYNDTLYGDGGWSRQVRSRDRYGETGLTWPLRTQRGFNVRLMPAGAIFGHKGPAILPKDSDRKYYILGVANSELTEYVLDGLTSFGSWEVGAVKKIPFPSKERNESVDAIGTCAREIYYAKANWNCGSETVPGFTRPWVLDSADAGSRTMESSLDSASRQETNEEERIRQLYDDLNSWVYELHGIPGTTRKQIKETLGPRPPEVLWPQMEGKTADQKRMEHVFRLLSYAVKRVVEADDDGIVPFAALNEEAPLVERVRAELGALFPGRDINQLEIEITNELKKTVKGYRRTKSIGEWLDNVYFDYHVGLYKNRPIYWHVASAPGTERAAFGVLCHYHKLDKNRFAKLRGTYLREAIDTFRREAALADKERRADDKVEWQAKLEEAQALDGQLAKIQEGAHEGPEGGERDFRILTPWKTPEERPKGWNPDIDDGVKVNLLPLQRAGVLRVERVIPAAEPKEEE